MNCTPVMDPNREPLRTFLKLYHEMVPAPAADLDTIPYAGHQRVADYAPESDLAAITRDIARGG